MQVRTRHTPNFGVARLILAPGEPVRSEPDAMVATSYGVVVEQRASGALKALTKAGWGADPLPAATYTAPPQGGWVDVAPHLPGDLHVVELNGGIKGGWCLARSRWLASAATVTLDNVWPGFRSLFGADSGFLVHAEGQGSLVLSCFGALDVISLQAGELVTVDSGHLVGYSEGVQARLRALAQGGPQSIKTGEGLVFDFAGPGEVLAQTRNPRTLASSLHSSGGGSRL
ncbi:TIGR00266 family protein [Allokutzneria albata]|uniref:TIGR00266 family protein n=1 Tax=Allokutzneria albata TaxID=211114 RepID=A0A1H0AVX1_ALLAB|nr:TIGR00266 family protein [Allokutzneria albata]SDN37203.1 TIGR00266 family protein [Allokutzneria albata]